MEGGSVSFYLRKSVKAGPFRVNLSKSGLGISTGVPGLRVGAGPRGSYVRVGAHGVFYQQTLTPRHRPTSGPNSPRSRQLQPPNSPTDDIQFEDVAGVSTLEFADASPSEMISQINDAAKHWSMLPLVVLLCLPLVTIPLAILLHARDKARRTVVAFYEVNDEPSVRFQALTDSFASLEQCASQWHITAQGAVRTTQQYKTHAGASAIIRRDHGKADLDGPPVLATNIAVPSLHSKQRSVYFLPDRVLVRDGKRYADMPYSECKIVGTTTRFIEDGSVPRDAERVGTTWKYVNKKGGPDRRYKNNRQLPIMLYGELSMSTSNGFNFIWQTSRATAPAIARTIAAIRSPLNRNTIGG
jgi:Protein of unknown function (DUF4236)